jgi:hypothetical protein
MEELSFEASDLRFPPGQWPETFVSGNYKFYLVCLCHRNGEVEYACYADPISANTAVVFND